MVAPIRVPSGAKREPNAIRFKPLGETRVDDVARTLEDLYVETDKPVSARQIGDVVGMQPHQTLAYLHEAKDVGGPIPCQPRIGPRAGSLVRLDGFPRDPPRRIGLMDGRKGNGCHS